MATLIGVEFHRYPDTAPLHGPAHTGEFYRAIHVGSTLLIRRGVRGTPGKLEIYGLNSPDEAKEEALRVTAHLTWNAIDWEERCRVTFEVDDPDPTPIELERRFAAHWSRAVFARHDWEADLGPQWCLVTHSLAEHASDTGARAVFDEITAHPHAIDHATDRIVGLLPRMPILQPDAAVQRPIRAHCDTGGGLIGISKLAPLAHLCPHGIPSCSACTQRTADLLLFLCRDRVVYNTDPTERQAMADTAQRLIRAHTAPTPV